MTDNLTKARHLMDAGNYTCVLCQEDAVYTATERGVKPLLDWVNAGLSLSGFSAADRVVGRGAAFLYCLLDVKEVYARVMSRPAAAVLEACGIAVHTDNLVKGIINRRGTGPCPFEDAVMGIEDAHAALAAIRSKMVQMQKGN